jgi:hypothetical protein
MAGKIAAYRPRMEPVATIVAPAYRPRMNPDETFETKTRIFETSKEEVQEVFSKTYSKKRNVKSRPCENFITKGFCPYGYKCLYSHNLSIDNPKFKSVHCINFSKGYCTYGMKCSFLHCSSKIHPFEFLFGKMIQVPSKRLQVFVNLCQ